MNNSQTPRFDSIEKAESYVNTVIASHHYPHSHAYKSSILVIDARTPPEWLDHYLKAKALPKDSAASAATSVFCLAASIAFGLGCFNGYVMLFSLPLLFSASLCVGLGINAAICCYQSYTIDMHKIEHEFLCGKKNMIKKLAGNNHKDDDLGPQFIYIDKDSKYSLKCSLKLLTQELHFNYEAHKPAAQAR